MGSTGIDAAPSGEDVASGVPVNSLAVGLVSLLVGECTELCSSVGDSVSGGYFVYSSCLRLRRNSCSPTRIP